MSASRSDSAPSSAADAERPAAAAQAGRDRQAGQAGRDEQPAYGVVCGTVEAVELVSPSFVRITFGGPGVDQLGNPAETFDQRIKLIFPPASGVLPDLSCSGDEWYQAWLAVDEAQRGSMRTYSIRDVVVDDGRTSLVIDFVLHLVPGETGPASTWASTATIGDELLIVGPRRGRFDGGGIEYRPGDARMVLLAGDETAAPAIARIIEDSGPELRGAAFIEVPTSGDRLDIAAPDGFEVRWLARAGVGTGTVLIPAVLEHLEHLEREAAVAEEERARRSLLPEGELEIRDVDSEALVWETPDYSGLGEPVEGTRNHSDSYFWIAGESGTVTTLRRHLVRGLGIDRSQVAFMGYWRRGVAMKG